MSNEQQNGEDVSGKDETNDELTPKRAHELKEQGMSYREIGNLYDLSKDTARRRKVAFDDAYEAGKKDVSPTDFEAEELTNALNDKEDAHNPFETADCPACGADVRVDEDCEDCGAELDWS